MRNTIVTLICVGFFLTNSVLAQTTKTCPQARGVSLQVLGSGGPIADDGRASASYVVWIDGRSRVLIDVGGGAFLRFGEASARFEDLDFVGLSHFHTDHSADFPTLLKSGYFSSRDRDLVVAGPIAGGPFPGLADYLLALIEAGSGAFAYLAGYLDGSAGLVRLQQIEVDTASPDPSKVLHAPAEELLIEAIGVPHGIVPALAFKVHIGGLILVFASDQNGTDSRFVEFATGANTLVMHMPIPEGASGAATKLHATPRVLGKIAKQAGVDTLVLSHFMARSLRNIDENVAAVRAGYGGRIVIADDLVCLNID
ncbi:MAG: MBL fold metallo-hydrolase [Woeseiaceae bacterium]